MTILDRNTGSRLRMDVGQIADELAKRLPDFELPDFDKTRDQAASAVHDAAGQARHQIERAAEVAKGIGGDIAQSAEKVVADNPIDEIGQRIRAVASPSGVRALISRLEKELPDTDRDRYQRAYARGRAQARSKYVFLGLAAGIGAGAVAALLLDPKHGKERRDAIAGRTSSLTKSAAKAVSGKAKVASERARGLAIERGMTESPATEPVDAPRTPVFSDGPVTDPSSTVWEPLPSVAGDAVPAGDIAMSPTTVDAAETAGPIVSDALNLASARSTTRSVHG
ncbi:MAG TPA: hypothetical protein VES19_16970 [Candidatus Limnocylindrales bacterium]|nr:hypothetical protein [Candidatus Limnocylindrales bacterium]